MGVAAPGARSAKVAVPTKPKLRKAAEGDMKTKASPSAKPIFMTLGYVMAPEVLV